MDIEESMNLMLASQEVIGERFYRVFLDRYPEVQEHFRGVNMQRQAALLTTALIVVQSFRSTPHRAISEYLRYLGTKHQRWQIPKHLYVLWTNAMLETMKEFHGETWTEDLADQWRKAIGLAIEVMFQGYEEPFQV